MRMRDALRLCEASSKPGAAPDADIDDIPPGYVQKSVRVISREVEVRSSITAPRLYLLNKKVYDAYLRDELAGWSPTDPEVEYNVLRKSGWTDAEIEAFWDAAGATPSGQRGKVELPKPVKFAMTYLERK